jgi:hypothetical protein
VAEREVNVNVDDSFDDIVIIKCDAAGGFEMILSYEELMAALERCPMTVD